MRIEYNWIYFADKALRNKDIVKTKCRYKDADGNEIETKDNEYVYHDVFNGYISSFGATIVNTGVYPALLIYENKKSNADGKRYLLPEAILYMLTTEIDESELSGIPLSEKYRNMFAFTNGKASLFKNITLPNEGRLLSEKYNLSSNKVLFQKYIEKAATALKMALRMYKPVKFEKKNSNKKKEKLKVVADEISKKEYDDKNTGVNTKSNIGWLFYRDYYRDYNTRAYKYYDKDKRKTFEGMKQELIFGNKKNPYILSSKLYTGTTDEYNMLTGNIRLSSDLKDNGFIPLTFKTMYPGLIIGLGLTHGTAVDNDLKCGFQFDYTTGLPYIPGSSVKGVLRSMFPFKGDEKEDVKFHYIESLLKADNNKILENKDVDFSKEDIEELAENIFEHKGKATYDIFMDAIITGCTTKDGKFLSDDFITPQHDNPYGDPNPIQFIKVLPDVEFTFFFKFTECKCNGVDINLKELFRCILEDIGIGAKTNVGYGQLKLIE